MTEQQLVRLFDIVPGLQSCKLNTSTGIAEVKYESPECASHAVEKLHRLEYPPGVLNCEFKPSLSEGYDSKHTVLF